MQRRLQICLEDGGLWDLEGVGSEASASKVSQHGADSAKDGGPVLRFEFGEADGDKAPGVGIAVLAGRPVAGDCATGSAIGTEMGDVESKESENFGTDAVSQLSNPYMTFMVLRVAC